MKQETSQWGKAVKKAVIDHDMTLKQLAEKIGYSNATVSQVVNGRYSNSSSLGQSVFYTGNCGKVYGYDKVYLQRFIIDLRENGFLFCQGIKDCFLQSQTAGLSECLICHP